MNRSRPFAVALSFASFVAVVAACSNSTSGGTGAPGIPSCQGATGSTGPGTAACNSCLQTNCASQLSSVESACGAYLTCDEACQCSDTTCLAECVTTKIDGACATADGPFTSCLTQSCPSQCEQTIVLDSGGGG
jgi:hypothetical protein